jgi:hypothetical protein
MRSGNISKHTRSESSSLPNGLPSRITWRRASRAGQLTVDENGFGLLVFETGAPGPSYDAAFVTLQQSGATEPGGLEILRS